MCDPQKALLNKARWNLGRGFKDATLEGWFGSSSRTVLRDSWHLERRARRRVDESQGGCQKVKKHWVMKVKIYSTVLRLELMINI